ncbi:MULTISPECIES: sensor histidine kinase [Catenuloplanes]|uniref:histidine kinase n=1 Tax=Catenuloplanes niger TaxID=587534 RepID=A0AAE3ZYF7_9ACTN|nr:HAMP domain-containing sensor histidine kinase [Catenuloplanes niger]MDR7327200.1 signal transduction histidine kinase [Catenuloplanes niger]
MPAFTRSIRFRLTALYSGILFALAGAGLAVTYVVVERVTDPKPITTRYTAQLVKEKADGREYPVGTLDVAAIEEIESEVNLRLLETLRTYSLLALGVLFLVSLALGWVLAGRALRPAGAIARTAREIQATDLSRRIRLDGPRDELRDLADTIDEMLDRLDAAFRAQRQLIDDASHELRSPLAIIRANLDASLTAPEATDEERARATAIVDRATTRMSRLVEDLLATARRDADALADTEADLAEVAREAGEEFAAPAEVTVRTLPSDPLLMIGDPDALRRAAGNLLSNAVRVSPAGGTVTIGAGRSGGWLWLAVTDEGPGIAETEISRVFDRFWRGTAGGTPRGTAGGTPRGTAGGTPRGTAGGTPRGTAGGTVRGERRTGLGLAIVRQIVESHGGQPAVFSTVGAGSTFVLWLPAAGRADDAPPPAANPMPR